MGTPKAQDSCAALKGLLEKEYGNDLRTSIDRFVTDMLHLILLTQGDYQVSDKIRKFIKRIYKGALDDCVNKCQLDVMTLCRQIGIDHRGVAQRSWKAFHKEKPGWQYVCENCGVTIHNEKYEWVHAISVEPKPCKKKPKPRPIRSSPKA